MKPSEMRHHRLPPWAMLATIAIAFAACGDDSVVAPTATPELAIVGGADVSQSFVVTSTGDDGAGSLREAIHQANASPGLDGITFDVPGPGPHTIQPLSPLPVVTDPVIIDGYAQPGATPNTQAQSAGSNAVLRIELDGSAVGPAVGLLIAGGHSTVRGLAIHGFQDGIVLVSAANRVQGTFIGTDVGGAGPAPNAGAGIVVTEADNQIGGSLPADRNVISGNLGDGVLIIGPGAVRNQVAGNYLGLDATGSYAIPNNLPEPDPLNSAGVHITAGASENLVGGPGSVPGVCVGACNVISGNNRSGVWIENDARHNTVQGNRIGTTADGARPLGNFRWGVFLGGLGGAATHDNTVVANDIQWSGRDGVAILTASSGNAIGGLDVTPGACDGACNRIMHNGQRFDTQGDGVRLFVQAGTGNSILGNSIALNPQGLGIDLGARGVAFNDFGDFDVGPNNLQNYPVLTSASGTPGHLIVSGTIDTPDPESVLIEIFGNPVPEPGADPSGFGEGAIFLGRAAPDAEGSFTARVEPMPAGALISATATAADGSTSEFAGNLEVVPHRGPDADRNPRFFPFSALIGTCGEIVSVTGSFHEISRFSQDGAGGFHFTSHINATGIGIGQTTGATYLWNDAINQQGSFRGPQETFTSQQSFSLIGRGDAPDLSVRALFHVTVTPQGVVNITVDSYETDCG